MNAGEQSDRIHESVMNDAHALLEVTASAAQEPVVHARQKLAGTLKAARDAYALADKKSATHFRAEHKMAPVKPYEAAGVAFGLGALIGFLMGRHR